MKIQTVTVIGASGTMGARVSAIFASFGNAKVYMVGRDLQKTTAAVQKAVRSVRADSIRQNLIPADCSMLEACTAQSDLIFESVSEAYEVKKEFLSRLASSLRADTLVCSGTSGLSVQKLAECLPEQNRKNFFGVHMFNPPYNMPLCELISTDYSDLEQMEELKYYLEHTLLRTVVEVKDSPAFLANRIGFQFINEAMQYAEKYKDNGGIDYIDAILGPFTGRAMAPLATADFVGLDVHKAIVDNIYQNTEDFAHDSFVLPAFAQALIDEGKLGQKTKQGLYKTEIDLDGRRQVRVYDIRNKVYRDRRQYVFSFAEQMKSALKSGNYQEAFAVLTDNTSLEAGICLRFLLKYMVYSAVAADLVAPRLSCADDVMAAGFNWCPPFAMLQGLSTVADVKTLMEKYLGPNLSAQVDLEAIFAKAEPSGYDYRPYFKSSK